MKVLEFAHDIIKLELELTTCKDHLRTASEVSHQLQELLRFQPKYEDLKKIQGLLVQLHDAVEEYHVPTFAEQLEKL
jgi:hypothetical protein